VEACHCANNASVYQFQGDGYNLFSTDLIGGKAE